MDHDGRAVTRQQPALANRGRSFGLSLIMRAPPATQVRVRNACPTSRLNVPKMISTGQFLPASAWRLFERKRQVLT
jgi:hypothetical protein